MNKKKEYQIPLFEYLPFTKNEYIIFVSLKMLVTNMAAKNHSGRMSQSVFREVDFLK